MSIRSSNFIEFIETNCISLEAPAAVPVSASVNVVANLVGDEADSIIAEGTVTATRETWTRGQQSTDLPPNKFALVRDECATPNAVTIVTNTESELGGGVALAKGPAIVVSPAGDNPGLIELYYSGTLFELSAKIRIGSVIFTAFAVPEMDPGFTPSTWEEAAGVIEVVLSTEPGSDPAGSVTFTFTVS